MSCFDEGWNLAKRSFFFVSFSFWKVRVLSAVVFIASIAVACLAIDTSRRLRTPGGMATVGSAMTIGATAGGDATPTGGGGWRKLGIILKLWHCR